MTDGRISHTPSHGQTLSEHHWSAQNFLQSYWSGRLAHSQADGLRQVEIKQTSPTQPFVVEGFNSDIRDKMLKHAKLFRKVPI